MNNLMDVIRQNMQKAPETAASDTLSQTAQAQSLLATKATGKAQPAAPAPALSNVGEQVAKQQTQLGTMAQSRQAALQGSEMGQAYEAQKADIAFAQSEATQAQNEASSRLLNEATRILDGFSQQGRELDYNRDRARMEQLGFTLRLSSDNYVQNLKREGTKARLDNGIRFKEELQRTIFEDEEELFRDNLNFRKLMNADDRAFATELSKLGIEDALAVARAQSRQANMQAQYEGFGQILQGGVQGAVAYYGKPESKVEVTNTTVGVDSTPNLGGKYFA